jgi:hypothetical protein
MWQFIVPVSKWTNFSVHTEELKIQPRYAHGITTIGDSLYVFGGLSDSGESPFFNLGFE